MRIRTIKPEFWESEIVGSLGPMARLTFIGLLNIADDEGRGRGSEAFIWAELHKYYDHNSQRRKSFGQVLAELAKSGLVEFYQDTKGCAYFFIPGFREHQKLDYRRTSKLPEPPKKDPAPNFPEKKRAAPNFRVGTGIREQGSGIGSGNREQSNSSEPEKEPAPEQTVLTFPTIGQQKTWGLTQKAMDMFTGTYTGVHIPTEFKKARAWLESNPTRRKTPRGMMKFLNGWAERAQNQGRRTFGIPAGNLRAPIDPSEERRQKIASLVERVQ